LKFKQGIILSSGAPLLRTEVEGPLQPEMMSGLFVPKFTTMTAG
jgi:hypothetical protein